jgi:thiol peroxidase
MDMERRGLLTLADRDVTIIGPDLEAGDAAPGFAAQTFDWSIIRPMEDTAGKVRILAPMPSLETSVCDRETRRFNQEAAQLGEDIAIVVISMDLPYTQKRWCGAEGIDRVLVVSDHLEAEFGRQYGCLVKERRILRRAVFVVGRDDRIVYAAYMPSIGMEPDYAAVLAAARGALT